ncbi:hypothetical protein SAMD00019534_077730 [Acytostelium subglobosum LB1]|uniref:hypothetical protein n=1 Tax=Acytostelium subglobosum LB1 TaxID=1410327 RepID=UPI000644F8F9|nr:hypothetical protein SAMD00019534_077730 [Acytostelium subglobosum LB1]GAM24598.1 hypothetical protein SAMD00019534_077730 [Acytostelium subglobosum LB1]|eukprot:XP_012752267.1 hypothetical protein SAMD00019534_077730 [Acytostelium subglobosum LB1]
MSEFATTHPPTMMAFEKQQQQQMSTTTIDTLLSNFDTLLATVETMNQCMAMVKEAYTLQPQAIATFLAMQNFLDKTHSTFNRLSIKIHTHIKRNEIVQGHGLATNNGITDFVPSFTDNIDRLLKVSSLKMPSTGSDMLLPEVPHIMDQRSVNGHDDDEASDTSSSEPGTHHQSMDVMSDPHGIPLSFTLITSITMNGVNVLDGSDKSEQDEDNDVDEVEGDKSSTVNSVDVIESEQEAEDEEVEEEEEEEEEVNPSDEHIDDLDTLPPTLIVEPTNEFCSTPFSPSSPPMSPSPMALATSQTCTLIDSNALILSANSSLHHMEEVRCFQTFEKSMTEMAVYRIRINMTDDAIQKKNQKGCHMMSVILQDQSAVAMQQTVNNSNALLLPLPVSEPTLSGSSPIETYIPVDEEDLAHMYTVYKPVQPIPAPPPALTNGQGHGGVGGGNRTTNQTNGNGNKYKSIVDNGSSNNTNTKVITWSKSDVSGSETQAPQFQYVKEKVPRCSNPSVGDEDSDIEFDDYDDYDIDSDSPSYDDSSFTNETATPSASARPSNHPTTASLNNNNTTNSGSLLKSPTNMKTLPLSPKGVPISPKLFLVRSSQRRAQSVSAGGGVAGGAAYNSYPWVGGKLMHLNVFVPTQPQSVVELSVDDDSTVEKVVSDVLELCQKERKRRLLLSGSSNQLYSSLDTLATINPQTSQSQALAQATQTQTQSTTNNPNNNNNTITTSTKSSDSQSPNLSNGDNEISFAFLSGSINPKAYLLKVCSEDGNVSADTHMLDRLLEIKKTKSTSFILIQNPNCTREQHSPPPIFRVHILPSAPLNVERKSSVSNSVGVKDSIAVPYTHNATLASIKSLICRKEKFSEEFCVFMLMNNEVVNDESITLEELGMGDIKLIHNQVKTSIPKSVSFIADSGNAPRPITKLLGPMFFFTPDTAGEFKQYQVVKFNKFGTSTVRVMGIDQDRIIHSNMSVPNGSNHGGLSPVMSPNNCLTPPPKSKKSFKRSFNNNSKLKTPIQLLTDIASVNMITNKPKNFYIKCKDGKLSEFYSQDAEEIVAKIQFIIKEKRNKSKNEY